MGLRRYILLLFLLIGISATGQNTRTIRGEVVDARDKEPLVGATIVIKGTTKGTITDFDGNFSYTLQGPEIGKTVLEISFVGYEQQSLQVKDQSVFKILLKEDVNALDEIVVTSSYGTKKLKQEVVGSIANIKTKDIITEQSVVSIDQLLEGQTAGVYVESGTELGEPVNIHIRGQGSLTPLGTNNVGSSTQPLIIVDGVILSEEITLDGNSLFDGGDGKFSEDIMNPLAKVGIDDIESINVLKDAAAVSLYGADGANGVILITTKGGKKGPLKFNFKAQGGFNAATNQIKYMNGEQYQYLRNLYYANSGQTENVQEWNGTDTDWFGLLNRNGIFQNYNISASGGSDKISYRLSLDYKRIQESQIKNNYARYSTGITLGYTTKKLNVSLKIAPSFTEKNSPNTLYSYAVPPTLAPYNDDGTYTSFNFYGNPLAVANQNRALNQNKGLLNSVTVSYKILKSLNFSTLYGMDFSDKEQDNYYSGLNETGKTNKGELGRRNIRKRNTRNWNWNAKLFLKNNLTSYIIWMHWPVLKPKGTRQSFQFIKDSIFQVQEKYYQLKMQQSRTMKKINLKKQEDRFFPRPIITTVKNISS